MKKFRLSEHQIINTLKEVETSRTARKPGKYGINSATYYTWKSKLGDMEASDVKQTCELEYENVRLKQIFADLSLKNRALKDVIKKNSKTSREARVSLLCSQRARVAARASPRCGAPLFAYQGTPGTLAGDYGALELVEVYPCYGLNLPRRNLEFLCFQ